MTELWYSMLRPNERQAAELLYGESAQSIIQEDLRKFSYWRNHLIERMDKELSLSGLSQMKRFAAISTELGISESLVRHVVCRKPTRKWRDEEIAPDVKQAIAWAKWQRAFNQKLGGRTQ